jgi:hypothetical protein
MPIAKFGILASVALVSAALGQSVAFAWGVGGGGIGIPGFGALWQQPSPPGFSRGKDERRNGGSVGTRWSKGKNKGQRSADMPPGQYGR